MDDKTRPGIPDLAKNRADRLLSLANAVSGGLAELGPTLSEIIGVVLPARRVDRIVTVLELLEARVTDVEAELIRQKLGDSEEAQDLLEEGMLAASRSTSQDRAERIAEMLKRSLTSDDLDYEQKKRLWGILAELSDLEVLILQYYGVYDDGDDFWERHQDALTGPIVHMGSSADKIDQGAVYESFRAHLSDLGLIRPRYKQPRRGETPEFDVKTGMMKASGAELTRLGGIFLRYLGLPSRI